MLIKRGNMHFPRCYHAMGYINKMDINKTEDLIVATGSKYPESSSRTCEYYDVWKNEWKQLPELNQARHYHSVSIIQDENTSTWVYVIGGRSSDESPLDSIERLNFDECRGQALENARGWELLEIRNVD